MSSNSKSIKNSRYIERDVLRRLSVCRPHITAFAIVADWLVIAAAIAISEWSGSWLVYLASVFVIGGRMHALGVLVHDFAHYRFIRDKRLSEWIGDIFCAWPILITVDGYRRNHLEHHLHTNTDKDPDFVVRRDREAFNFPATARRLALHMAGYLVSWQSLVDIARFHMGKGTNKVSIGYQVIRYGFSVVVITLAWMMGGLSELFFYWLVPFFTVFFALMHVRAVAEHFCDLDYSSLESGTRTVMPLWWERPFFAPHGVNYHLEHHLYPGVPFYNLPQLHQALMENPVFRARAHVTTGYTTGLVREALGAVRRGEWLEAAE